MNNTIITAYDFVSLAEDCVNALIASGNDSNTAVDTVNGVIEMYSEEINNMDFGNVSEVMSIMFLGRRYEDSLG